MTTTEQPKYLIDAIRQTMSENEIMTHDALAGSPVLIGASNDEINRHLLTLLQNDEISILHNISDTIPYAYVWKGSE